MFNHQYRRVQAWLFGRWMDCEYLGLAPDGLSAYLWVLEHEALPFGGASRHMTVGLDYIR